MENFAYGEESDTEKTSLVLQIPAPHYSLLVRWWLRLPTVLQPLFPMLRCQCERETARHIAWREQLIRDAVALVRAAKQESATLGA
jgi:hypothetical protein